MANIGKAEIVDFVAQDVEGVSKAKVKEVLDALFENVEGLLVQGDSFAWQGFGALGVVERAARTARNPHTGESVDVPARKAIKFKPSKNLTAAVNE